MAFSGSQTTRLGFTGTPAALYGAFAGKSTGTAADAVLMTVAADPRIMRVAAETRTMTVAAETRIMRVRPRKGT